MGNPLKEPLENIKDGFSVRLEPWYPLSDAAEEFELSTLESSGVDVDCMVLKCDVVDADDGEELASTDPEIGPVELSELVCEVVTADAVAGDELTPATEVVPTPELISEVLLSVEFSFVSESALDHEPVLMVEVELDVETDCAVGPVFVAESVVDVGFGTLVLVSDFVLDVELLVALTALVVKSVKLIDIVSSELTDEVSIDVITRLLVEISVVVVAVMDRLLSLLSLVTVRLELLLELCLEDEDVM